MTQAQLVRLQQGVNYTTIFKTLGYSLSRLWGFLPQIERYIFTDAPLTEYFKEVSLVLQINETDLHRTYTEVADIFSAINLQYDIITIKNERYSPYLKASLNPPPVLFTRGNNDLLTQYPAVAVVGTRQASSDGKKRARKLSIILGDMGFVVASGLARGIDTAAHLGAIETNGKTMAVIGTNLADWYPPENKWLQEKIAQSQLLISQFPFGHPITKANFPTRNQTMSGLSLATIIVEAGETSGALIQAQQCLRQKRKLFILKNLIDNPALEWPKKYEGLENVYIVSKIEDLISELQKFRLIQEQPKITTEDKTLFET
jgi:DNA processing protein